MGNLPTPEFVNLSMAGWQGGVGEWKGGGGVVECRVRGW